MNGEHETVERGWAIVTGASSGIGLVFARELAARGHRVLAVARRRGRLETLAAEVKGVEILVADLGSPEGIAVVAARAKELGHVAVLVNNAGFGESGHYLELSIERELECIRVNVCAVVELTHRLLPGMVARGSGAVINVASTIAFQPVPYFSTYAATKAFVLHYSEGVAHEVAASGVKVIALCPGPVETEFESHSGNTKFQRSIPNLKAEEVVAAGLAALEGQAPVRVVGLVNRILSIMNSLMPRAFVRWNMGRLAKPESRPLALPAAP